MHYHGTIHGGCPGAVVKDACLESRGSRVRSPLCLQVLKKQKVYSRFIRKYSILWETSVCDREVACSAADRQDSNFESCVQRAVPSHLSHHHQEVLLV